MLRNDKTVNGVENASRNTSILLGLIKENFHGGQKQIYTVTFTSSDLFKNDWKQYFLKSENALQEFMLLWIGVFKFQIRNFQTSASRKDIDQAAKYIGAGAATVGAAGSGNNCIL